MITVTAMTCVVMATETRMPGMAVIGMRLVTTVFHGGAVLLVRRVVVAVVAVGSVGAGEVEDDGWGDGMLLPALLVLQAMVCLSH